MVSNQNTHPQALPNPLGLPYISPTQERIFGSVNFADCVSKGAVDSFAYVERVDCLCILPTRGFCCYISAPFLLKKREISVASVGKSEKSSEKILLKFPKCLH